MLAIFFVVIVLSSCNVKNYRQFLNRQLNKNYSAYTGKYDTIIH
jgi:hypothetical protein